MDINSWLKQWREKAGIIYVSQPHRFAHDETKYDEQYKIDPKDIQAGKGLVSLLRRRDASFRGPALEIGCGTGRLSLGLAQENVYPVTLLTDPSVKFLKIVQEKITRLSINQNSIRYAVLSAEEIGVLPENTFSLIALRSTLHHVLDVSKFIHEAARALLTGGILTFEEPCREGFIIMGMMAQFMIPMLEAKGIGISGKHQSQIKTFIDVMKFYSRYDVDKTSSEDKHVFRVDDVMKQGQSAGLKVEFLPNRVFDEFIYQPVSPHDRKFFNVFFKKYLSYCMSFDNELIGILDKHFFKHFPFIEDISEGDNAPYMHGVFICIKL